MSWCPVPEAIHINLWSTKCFFENFVTNNRNGTFAQISYMFRAGSMRWVDMGACIGSIILRQLLHYTLTPDDSVPAGTVMSFAFSIVACLYCSRTGAQWNNIYVTLASESTANKATGAYHSGFILRSMEIFLECTCQYTWFWVGCSLPGFGGLGTKFESMYPICTTEEIAPCI